jgi:hypothetical protein
MIVVTHVSLLELPQKSNCYRLERFPCNLAVERPAPQERNLAASRSRRPFKVVAVDRATSVEGAQEEGRRADARSGSARRNDDRRSIARGCGRLGLCRARPARSPSRRASRESTWRGRSLEIESTAAMAPSG